MSSVLPRALSWCAATTAYVATVLFDLPRPLYLPVSGELSMVAPTDAIAMGWYGALFVAAIVGLLSGGLTSIAPVAGRLGSMSAQNERRVLMGVLGIIFLQVVLLAGFELIPR